MKIMFYPLDSRDAERLKDNEFLGPHIVTKFSYFCRTVRADLEHGGSLHIDLPALDHGSQYGIICEDDSPGYDVWRDVNGPTGLVS